MLTRADAQLRVHAGKGGVERAEVRHGIFHYTGVQDPQRRIPDLACGNGLAARAPIQDVFLWKMVLDPFPMNVGNSQHLPIL